jgi:hypothetical protein
MSFERQKGNKAPGVDGVRKDDYAEGLAQRLDDLSAQLRRLRRHPATGTAGLHPQRGRPLSPFRGSEF